MARGVNEELWYAVGHDRKAQAEAAKNLAAKVNGVVSAKSFPIAAQRLAQLTKKTSTTTEEFAKVLKSDPGLSARLLRLVNSSGFALRAKCTSVEHALTLVGLEKLNQIATTAAIMDLYEETSGVAEKILEHATVVGALSRYLAFYLSLSSDDLFTCGFLHDIGKIMLLDAEGEDYVQLLERAGQDFDQVHLLEHEKYGFDHALLAGHVLAQWRIPNPIPKVIAWHHNIARAYADSNEVASMVSVVRLADAISYALFAEDDALEIERISKLEVTTYLEISESQLTQMWTELRESREAALGTYRESEPARDSDLARPALASIRVLARSQSMRPSMKPGSQAAPNIVSLPPDHDDSVELPMQRVLSPTAGLVGASIVATVLLGVLGALAASGPFRSAPVIAMELLSVAGIAALAWISRDWLFELVLGSAAEGEPAAAPVKPPSPSNIAALLPAKPVSRPRIVDVEPAANDNAADRIASETAREPEPTQVGANSEPNGAEAAIVAALSQAPGPESTPKNRWGRKRSISSDSSLTDPSIPRAPAMPQWSRPPIGSRPSDIRGAVATAAETNSLAHAHTALALSAPPEPIAEAEAQPQQDTEPKNGSSQARAASTTPNAPAEQNQHIVETEPEVGQTKPEATEPEAPQAPPHPGTDAFRSLTTMPAPEPSLIPLRKLEYEKEQSASASSKTARDEVLTTARKYSVLSLQPMRFERESRKHEGPEMPSDLPTMAPPSSERERLAELTSGIAEHEANAARSATASAEPPHDSPLTHEQTTPERLEPISDSPVRHSIDPYSAQAFGSGRPSRRAPRSGGASDRTPTHEDQTAPNVKPWSPWIDADDGPANGW